MLKRSNSTIMELGFFPGKDMKIKRYTSYFPMFKLSHGINTSVVLCHSKGIEEALKLKNVRIVAMDPSFLPVGNTEIFIWIREGRTVPEGILNVTIYREQTHHPYEIKTLRDRIVRQIKELYSL